MAQSSSYKQYGRTTRTLTEESGFAGGMLWTGNNIDETHLRAIVNCDYDDTTGYLKTRDAFGLWKDSPETGVIEKLGVDLTNYRLLCTHKVCAFDVENDDNLHDAGDLYIFTKAAHDSGVCNIPINSDELICIYHTSDNYHNCELDVEADEENVTLRNINASNVLLNYENQLYGLGSCEQNEEAWLWVYRVEYHSSKDVYNFKQLGYEEYVKPKINSVNLLEACSTGFNAAKGKDTFTYDPEINPDVPSILGVYFKDKDGNVVVSPRIGQDIVIHVPVGYTLEDADNPATHYLALFQLKEAGETATTNLVDSWDCIALAEATDGLFTFNFKFQKKKTTLGFTYYGTNFPIIEEPEEPEEPEETEGEETEGEEGAEGTEGTEEPAESEEPAEPEESEGTESEDTEEPEDADGAEETEEPIDISKIAAYADTAVDYLMPYVVTANDTQSNLKVKNYDLSTVDGICLWKNRLCVWGTESNHNSLFLSELDNFYYYPIPNNVALFDTNIMNCIPYKDTLLVFTTNKIYRVFENNDGTFAQSVVQNDMPLSVEDAPYLVAIKNMILFKSGNYFYMIVPKSQSLTDELNIAPIYKNIAGFLNTIDKSTQEVLQLLYPEYRFKTTEDPIVSAPTAVYAAQDTVYILYDVVVDVDALNDGEIQFNKRINFKMFLNYNTNLRAWTMYIEDTTDASLDVSALVETRTMSFIRINSSGDFDLVVQQPESQTGAAFRVLLDTGYRTLSSATQKRFREVQLKLHSVSENVTSFGTAFLVDGVWRKSFSQLEETLLDNGVVTLMPTLDLNTFITELSMPISETGDILKDPGSDSIELDDWTLDFSHFKREAPITIRVPVSGKGYNPRFIFMAPNATGITVNEINWVYRLMHGR